jgi:hypothetical protein
MNADEIRMIVQAVGARQQATPTLMPATVTDVRTADNVVSVRVDGQDFGSDVDVRPLVADLTDGDRVMVLFDPPRGGYVTGVIARRWSAGEVVAQQAITTAVTGVGDTGVTVMTAADVEFQDRRQYRLEAHARLVRNTGTPVCRLSIQTLYDLVATELVAGEATVSSVITRASVSPSVMFAPGARTLSVIVTAQQIGGAGAGTFDVFATTGRPATLTVTDAGPAQIID